MSINLNPMLNPNTPSIHIVRQYGPTGGMERYVWELTHALAKSGQPVKVVCEKAHAQPTSDIEVISLGIIKPKPRWLSMLKFSRNVSKFLNSIDTYNWVIHSHERCSMHQVTTFHGPSILNRKKRFFDFLSPRLLTWEALEKREVTGQSVKAVLPNSLMVAEQLTSLYPSIEDKICAPAYPGVDSAFAKLTNTSSGETIGFIGKEWQRKGLVFACDVIQNIRQQHPEIHFVVSGPSPDEIMHLFEDWPEESYTLLGWTPAEHVLPQIDLLIHPATSEPFGMVIAEANAAHIPVLISDQCGIAELINDESGSVLSLSERQQWQKSLLTLLKIDKVKSINLTWYSLANQHIKLYQDILQGKKEKHDDH